MTHIVLKKKILKNIKHNKEIDKYLIIFFLGAKAVITKTGMKIIVFMIIYDIILATSAFKYNIKQYTSIISKFLVI